MYTILYRKYQNLIHKNWIQLKINIRKHKLGKIVISHLSDKIATHSAVSWLSVPPKEETKADSLFAD